MTKIDVKNWLIESAALLSNQTDFPFVETQVLLGYVTGKSREWLVCHPEVLLTDDQVGQLSELLKRLLNGEPLPYLTGKQAFYGLDFIVNANVLIPRPETELLIEESIEWLENHPACRKIADVGTGSGAIAVTLADQFTDLRIDAIDISKDALFVAKENSDKYHVTDRIQYIENDLFTGLDQQYDLIAANLPYIPTNTLNNLSVSQFEPRLALDGGSDGFDVIIRLLEQATNHIRPKGLIILEIEASQSERCKNAAHIFYPNAEITICNDLANHPRIAKIQL